MSSCALETHLFPVPNLVLPNFNYQQASLSAGNTSLVWSTVPVTGPQRTLVRNLRRILWFVDTNSGQMQLRQQRNDAEASALDLPFAVNAQGGEWYSFTMRTVGRKPHAQYFIEMWSHPARNAGNYRLIWSLNLSRFNGHPMAVATSPNGLIQGVLPQNSSGSEGDLALALHVHVGSVPTAGNLTLSVPGFLQRDVYRANLEINNNGLVSLALTNSKGEVVWFVALPGEQLVHITTHGGFSAQEKPSPWQCFIGNALLLGYRGVNPGPIHVFDPQTGQLQMLPNPVPPGANLLNAQAGAGPFLQMWWTGTTGQTSFHVIDLERGCGSLVATDVSAGAITPGLRIMVARRGREFFVGNVS